VFGLVGLTVVLGILAVLTVLLADIGLATGLGRIHPLVVVLISLALVALITRFIGRGVWRTGQTLDSLVEAARRVEDGDYTVRVGPVRGGHPGVRELARSFNTMLRRLEEDRHQRRQLLADISHELRTPLAVIRGSVEARVDGVRPADPAHLGAIVEETRVIERLVEDLRTLALAESNALTLHREPVDPVELVRDVVASFGPLASETDVRLTVEASKVVWPVDMDPVRIREVIGNLVDNAIHHTPRGGRVSVRVDGPTPLRIEVEDTGPGIDPEVLPHIFDRFVRGVGSRGSGLGLAIARDLVTAHGGTIDVDSRPGAGSTFAVVLPV
jgi:two-component system sensor histidine kinase BaeS